MAQNVSRVLPLTLRIAIPLYFDFIPRLGGSDQRGRIALNCIALVDLTGLHPFASLAAHDGVFNCPLMMIGDFSVMIALAIGCKANRVEADSRPLGDAGDEKTHGMYDQQ